MSFMSAEKILGKQINILHILARPLYFSRAELISFVVIAVCIQRVVFFFFFFFFFSFHGSTRVDWRSPSDIIG